jgi:hypothetical protein
MKPTLFVLAAGMGSRYGGLKQLDGVGPSGETIMDYSIYDAINAGFGKLVFVIRKSFEEDFKEKIVKKYKHKIPVELVFQELDKLPEGFTVPPNRVKPWGTNHAVMMAKDVIDEPFAVINADDFYGRESFQLLGDFLSPLHDSKNLYAMVGYRVGNTLSESGAVARGICEIDFMKRTKKFILPETEIPTQWYNIVAEMKNKPLPMINPQTNEPLKAEDLFPLFAEELAKQELNDKDTWIDIPDEVREKYKIYRPTPLVRAYELEKALDTPAHIYFKNESVSPVGSHKLNSALAPAYYNKR